MIPGQFKEFPTYSTELIPQSPADERSLQMLTLVGRKLLSLSGFVSILQVDSALSRLENLEPDTCMPICSKGRNYGFLSISKNQVQHKDLPRSSY